MADKSIKLLFEVLGGGSIDGESGKTIKGQIESIVSEISKGTNIQLHASKESLANLRKEVTNSLKDIEVTVKTREKVVGGATQAGTGTGSGKSGSTDLTDKQRVAAAKKELNGLLAVYQRAQTAVNNAMRAGGKGVDIAAKVAEADRAYQAYAEAVKKAAAATNGLIKEETEMAVISAKQEELLRAQALGQADYVAKVDQEAAAIEAKINALNEEQQATLRMLPSYEKYQSALEALKSEDGFTKENLTRQIEAFNSFNEVLKQTKLVAMASEDAIAGMREKITDLLSKTQDAESIERLNGYLEQLGKGNVSKDALKNIANGVKEIGKKTGEAEPKVNTFGTTVKRLFTMFGGAAVFTRAVRSMITSVRELDASLAQMRIVTNGSEQEIESFAVGVAKSAKDIGSSITDLVDSATVFARLGYTESESSMLAKYTSMLSNVGDIDVSVAQDAMTSIVKAFQLNVDNIESVMDKMVAVGNHFPISVQEIAQGMANAGSALSASGNTFEESVALLTAAQTTVELCRATR